MRRHWHHSLLVLLLLAGCGLMPIGAAWAEEAAQASAEPEVKIVEIRIEGNNRVEKESILRALRSKLGEPVKRERVQADLRSLYQLGVLTDIQVDVRATEAGAVLTYMVEERPSVKEVKIKGNDKVSNDDVKEAIDIKADSILNYDKIRRNVDKISNVYVEKGYFLADVDYELKNEAGNQVTVVFKINEHAKVQVKKITLLGNQKVKDEELLKVMLAKPGDALSFITNNGQYRQELVERDAYFIGNYYADHGYINAKVSTPEVFISPDRQWIYLTFPINEGEAYKLGEMTFEGDLLFTDAKLRSVVRSKKGQIFNRSRFLEDMERIAALYKDLGYAYANVVPYTTPHDDSRIVDMGLQIQKGKKVRIERINVVGNTRTRDKVVRREMRIAEGDLYSTSGVNRSKRRIYQLGYFETVEIKEEPGSRDDLLTLTIEVKERRTGTFQLGFGFSTAESFVFQSQINQDNLLGRGQSLSLMAQISSTRKLVQVSFFEPYFFDSRFNFAFSAYSQDYQYPKQGDFGSYSDTAKGGSLSLGYPVLDDLTLSLTYAINQDRIYNAAQMDLHLYKSGRTSSFRFNTTLDTRDNRLFPTDGWLVDASLEYADKYTGSEIKFLKYLLNTKFFYPVWWKLVFKVNMEVGYYQSLERANADKFGKKDFPGLPISARFFLGGIMTLRGYDYYSISPSKQVTNQNDPLNYPVKYLIGGNKEFYTNIELEFPLIEPAGLKWVFFFDAGNTWSEQQNFFYIGQKGQDPYHMPLGLYMSYGFGLRWYSPVGPLRFEWGLPVKRRPQDDKINFEFSIGNQF